jgi:hypothetical protein
MSSIDQNILAARRMVDAASLAMANIDVESVVLPPAREASCRRRAPHSIQNQPSSNLRVARRAMVRPCLPGLNQDRAVRTCRFLSVLFAVTPRRLPTRLHDGAAADRSTTLRMHRCARWTVWRRMPSCSSISEVVKADPDASAEIGFSARILAKDGHVVACRLFVVSRKIDKLDPVSAVAAFNDAFESIATELIAWTADEL